MDVKNFCVHREDVLRGEINDATSHQKRGPDRSLAGPR